MEWATPIRDAAQPFRNQATDGVPFTPGEMKLSRIKVSFE